MIQIRSNVFETNSSSTHSICISKKEPKIGSYVSFNLGRFGWENSEADTADYLYTAIMCRSDHDKLLDKLKKILDNYGIMYDFEEPKSNSWSWYDFYIDHAEELGAFINTVLNDEDMLMRLLFNSESVVYTGNDNDFGDDKMCDIACDYEYVRDDDAKPKSNNLDDLLDYYHSGNWVYKKVGNWDNPYYDPDNFDYFYKSN